MLNILPSQAESTIGLEVKEEVTGEDAKEFNQYVGQHFNKDERFSVLAFVEEMRGVTQQGYFKGIKVDARRWKHFDKFAIINKKDWAEASAKIDNYLPGIKVKVFSKEDQEKAWNWLKQ